MSVEQMLNSMDSRELVEWEVFNAKIEPVGATRQDWLFAMLANILALVNGNKKSQMSDYLLFPMKPPDHANDPVKPVKRINPMRAKILATFKGYEASRRARAAKPENRRPERTRPGA